MIENKGVLNRLEGVMTQAYFVYKITNISNGKSYIGASNDPERRWKEHRYFARHNAKYPIHFAIRKHGIHNFEMEILFGSRDKDYIFNEMESYFIKQFNTLHKGYNCTSGGQIHDSSERTKYAISEALKAAWNQKSPEQKLKIISHLNVIRDTQDSRQKQSDAARAQHADPISRVSHVLSTTKANQDPDKRKRIADAAKARWADPAFRDKMKNARNHTKSLK